MISKRDTAKLLAFVAAYDQRTVGATDVEAWFEVAKQARWELTYAQRAVIEHYTAETTRLMPAHITRRIRDRREHFATTYRHAAFPAGMRDADDQVEWERAQVHSHIEACMDRWAHGEDVAA